MQTPLINYQNQLSNITDCEIYLVHCRKKYPFNEIFTSIPEEEFFKNKALKWILGKGETNFLKYLKKDLKIRTILFFSDKYPIKTGNKIISLEGEGNILALDIEHARETNRKVAEDPYEPYLKPVYKDSLSRLRAGLNKEYKAPKKLSILERLFGKKEEVVNINQDEEDLRDILKSLPKIIHPHEEIGKRKLVLKDFWKKIKNREVENSFQKILEENPWIMGEEYFGIEVASTEKINKKAKSGIPDIKLLDPFDKQNIIYELKRPIKIIKKDSRRKDEFAPNAEIMNALWQGIRYIEEVRSKTEEYPRVFIIIGFGFPEEKKTLKLLRHYFPLIEILTYQKVYSRAKKRLDSFRPKRGLIIQTEAAVSKLKRFFRRVKKQYSLN